MTLTKVRREAKKISAIVVDEKIGHTHECTVEAPAGFIWNEGDVHMFVDSAYIPWKPDYDDILSRMSYGISKCEDEHCEWCHPEEE